MRTLMYRVRDNRGNEFVTTSYAETLKDENRLVETFLVKEDTENEKLKEKRRVHAQKIMDIFGIKGK
jgi:hypothetical protein